MKKPRLRYRTVILSDVHLGSSGCQAKKVNRFLKGIRCEKLILNGDIIDAWALRRSGSWTKQHSRFIRLVLQMAEKHGTQVVYLRGNHDDVLDRFLPFCFANVQLVQEYVHRTAQGDYLVLHGDVFDHITTHLTWLAKIGDLGYTLLLHLNRLYNRYREWRGLGYYSLSARVKASVKKAVSFISSYEDTLVKVAKEQGYVGVICGHIHTAADKNLDGVHYLNSGDWVESLTAIVEHYDGHMEVLDYTEFIKRLAQKKRDMAQKQRIQLEALSFGGPSFAPESLAVLN